MDAALSGYGLGLGLILVIGAQNAFVLRQGLRGEHVLAVCFTCATSDAILIIAGILGLGALIAAAPWIEPAFRWGGVLFLLAYGTLSFRAALKGGGRLDPAQGAGRPLGATLVTCLALTWLNPHVYLDTVFLIGSVSTQFEGERLAFGAGAVAASFSFFFALGFGARLLRPLFARPRAWQVLEVLVGCIMWTIAAQLAFGG
ncbi:LysE/ArgO family amino acid transporter [Pontivivens ytuae]|uniref:Amino acid transporter n=1 Tax=Pontivivens ytuae TaxID=2789856 RepID=A0A7S9LV61_9RHOB|nr:LysE/ArgO family amino acid transporter [Pontivivens ytuae]QPH55766.1 amino acid transporter [Pontivivens ytuae]